MASINSAEAGPTNSKPSAFFKLLPALSLPVSLAVRFGMWVLFGVVGGRAMWWWLLSTVIGSAGDLNANPSQGLTAVQNWAVAGCLALTALLPLAHGAALAALGAGCGVSARGLTQGAVVSGLLCATAATLCAWLIVNLVQPQNSFNQWIGDNFQFLNFADVDPLHQVLGVRFCAPRRPPPPMSSPPFAPPLTIAPRPPRSLRMHVGNGSLRGVPLRCHVPPCVAFLCAARLARCVLPCLGRAV